MQLCICGGNQTIGLIDYKINKVGINTTTPTDTLTVAGTTWCTNGTWAGSDERWKQNITPLTGSLDKITQLNGVSFSWKTNEYPEHKFIDGTQVGLIAQEVEEVIPELVRTNDDGYKGISYEKLVPYLVEGMKEQQKMIEKLQEEIAELKAE